MSSKPGERFAYCNANCQLLSGVLNKATGMSPQNFAKRELFDPLGINDFYWPADPKGINYGWGDLQLYPYDMLKIGELMLHHDEMNKTIIVSQNWLQNATKAHVTNTGGNDKYGYYWWVPGNDYPDVFEAVGRGGQRITVWPAKDIVIVFTGGGFNTSDLASFIVRAIKSDNVIEANPSALMQLEANIQNAVKAPVTTMQMKELPQMALTVSGKSYLLQKNTLDLSNLKISFNNQAQATMDMVWEGENVICEIGLDGKERFSFNPLVMLPQASTGEWINDTTLSIKLDLVGAINLYILKINFAEEGKKIFIDLINILRL